MSLMGSDTLPGTPGNQNATLTPILYNGVYYICVGTYINREPNFACTFFYNFINTSGSDFNGATMSVSFDNYGYVVLNGVKYPSTNPNMSLGYEGIGGIFIYDSLTNFTVTIPKGLNSLELRCVNMPNNPELNVWESQGLGVQPNNPSVAWLRITSSTSTVLVNTDATWRCTQFNYPAKFITPVSLGDVAENAGLSRPYSLAALSGKRLYDNLANVTILSLPLSLVATNFKTFASPTSNPLIYLQLFTNTNDTGSAASLVTTFGPVSFTTIAGKQCVYINNSVNTYLSLNYIPSTRFTIACWVYLIDTGDYTSSAIANVELTNSVLQFDFRYGEFQIPTALPNNQFSAGSWTLFPGISGATAGTWHFVAASINQANYQANYYLNGQFRASGTGTGPLPLRAKIIIGRSGDSIRPFNGYIRKYYFFNTILSESLINDLYSQG